MLSLLLRNLYLHISGMTFQLHLPSTWLQYDRELPHSCFSSILILTFVYQTGKSRRQIVNLQNRPNNIKPVFSSGVFIASCLFAMSYSMKFPMRAVPMNKYNEFLYITVSMGKMPNNARVIQFGRPCICLRDFL